jgi:hypothetical protein
MQSRETNAGIAVRGLLGILASLALTAGAALGVAAELQRGFQPMYEEMQARQAPAERDARSLPGTARVSRAAAHKAPKG